MTISQLSMALFLLYNQTSDYGAIFGFLNYVKQLHPFNITGSGTIKGIVASAKRDDTLSMH